MLHDVLLARYGELGIKSAPVRRRFEATLRDNIERAFEANGLDGIVRRIPGRFLVTSTDLPRARDLLTRIFGLTSVSPAHVATSRIDELLGEVPRYFDHVAGTRSDARTFALRTRRSGTHPYTSQDLARLGGAAILDRHGGARWKVDLDRPDVALHVEVRDHQAFLFHEVYDGPGGLPAGTQGKVVVLLKDVNSAVAAWLMMRRGCRVIPVTFTGPTGRPGRALQFLAALRRWNQPGDLMEVSHEETAHFPPPLSCALCMRQMLRKADLVAGRRNAKAIVTGEVTRSTTAGILDQFTGVARVPILRPLLGLGPDHVAELGRRIGLTPDDAAAGQEPCPLRVATRPDPVEVTDAESGHDLAALALDSVKARHRVSVAP